MGEILVKTEMLMHVVNNTGHIVPTEEVLQRVDRGYPLLMKSEITSSIKNIYPALLSESKAEVDARMAGLIALVVALFIGFISFIAVCCCLRFWMELNRSYKKVMTPAKSREHLIHRVVDDDLGLNTTENPLWVEHSNENPILLKLKTYEEQELSMHVMSEFDPAIVSTNPQGLLNGGGPNGINLDAQSNTYATIQKSHGGTLRSLQLRELQRGSTGTLNLGEDPGESNDYATLDHLKTAITHLYVLYPKSPEIKELVTSFTGSTFQPPDGTNMANRPLPEEPLEGRRYSKGSIGHAFDERNKNLIVRNTFHCSCDALVIKIFISIKKIHFNPNLTQTNDFRSFAEIEL
ncbi:hypothetical protein Avbf_11053 [Armadillidium vulgare]|nr:hypothetical protein Avbf_11053 [Armadillidium vulgare]